MNGDVELDDLLAAHAAGNLPEPLALIVASHLALSPESLRRYRAYEAVGGALLAGIEPAPVAPDAWNRLCAKLEDADREPPAPHGTASVGPSSLPKPLRDRLPPSLDQLSWYREGEASQAELEPGGSAYRTTLIRVPAGRPYPRHGHEGMELILVLEGGFREGEERHLRGDLVIAGPGAYHQPVALPGQDWLWLRVLDAPLRRIGPLGRLIDRLRRL